MKHPKILLVGTGNVGCHIIELLARDPRPVELFVADIDAAKAERQLNNAVIGAAHHGLHPIFHVREIDLNHIKQTAELIRDINPDVVINCAVMHTWHLIRRLPDDIYARLSSATLGAWLPVQLLLAYKVAQAIQLSGVNSHYINTSLSDLTNPVLGKIGLAPTIGVGNVDLIAPAIQTLVAQKLEVNRSEISVSLVAHHQHWVVPREAGYSAGAPYFLKLTHKNEVITDQFDTDVLMHDAVKLYPPGLDFTLVTASSAIKNLFALLSNEPVATHAPGPKGLPGGYPVQISSAGVEMNLPAEITEAEAVKLNESSQKLDGIETIHDDGTVVFSEIATSIMKDMLGFDCPRFSPEECESRAKELITLYRTFEGNYLN